MLKKSTLTPDERLEQLRCRVYTLAIRKILNKEDASIMIDAIESNRGRQTKAANDLINANIIRYSGKKASTWGSPQNIYTVHTDLLDEYTKERAKDYNPCNEDLIREHVIKCMEKSYRYGLRSFPVNHVGWYDIGDTDINTLSYVYLHREEYLFMGTYNSAPGHHPDDMVNTWEECKNPEFTISRQVYEVLPKVLLRNAVEYYAKTMYDYLAMKEAGLNGWTDAKTLNIELANVGKSTPTDSNISAIQDQCRKAIEMIEHYSKVCDNIRTAIKRNGGEKNWTKVILSLAASEMLRAAPMIASTDDEKISAHISCDRLDGLKDLSMYILTHGSLMSYDALYDDREGVLDINGLYEVETLDASARDTDGNSIFSSEFLTLIYGEEGTI